MVEPEIAFAHLEDAVALAEGLICHVIGYALETRREELKALERDTSRLEKVKAPFPWLHYDDAIELIRSKGSETQWGSDFGGTDETVIAEAYETPVVVHRFPSAIKAFYMEPDPKDAKHSLSADILAPEGYGEIVGGG
jgi:asparaginyl-tRNA synthetase